MAKSNKSGYKRTAVGVMLSNDQGSKIECNCHYNKCQNNSVDKTKSVLSVFLVNKLPYSCDISKNCEENQQRIKYEGRYVYEDRLSHSAIHPHSARALLMFGFILYSQQRYRKKLAKKTVNENHSTRKVSILTSTKSNASRAMNNWVNPQIMA